MPELNVERVTIPIDDLEFDEDNVNVESDDEFAGVVASIKDFGFLDDIWVYRRGDKYRVMADAHRTKAARFLGYTELPARVFDVTDDEVASVIAIRHNYARGRLSPTKFTKKFNELRRKYGADALRAMMGIADEKKWKNLYKDVRASLPPVVRRELDKTAIRQVV